MPTGKFRPALVVAAAPRRHPVLFPALLSSNTQQAIPKFDEIIAPSDSDYVGTGLKVRSVVRMAQLATVESAIINARLGRVSPDRLRGIKKRIADWLQM